MRAWRAGAALVAIMPLAASRTSAAQAGPSAAGGSSPSAPSSPSAIGPALGTWAFAPFVGGARHSPGGYNWGITSARDHLFIGMHMSTPVLRAGRLTLMYAPNVVPLVIISNNPRYTTVTTGAISRRVESGRGPVFGAGLVPFGLQVETRLNSNADVYAMSGLGGVWFSDVMPQDGARRFNFSIEFGGGIFLRTRRRHALQLGYKFHHFSNMYTARENPGVDGHVFYLGLRWQKRLPRE